MKNLNLFIIFLTIPLLFVSCTSVSVMDEIYEKCGRYNGGISCEGLTIIEEGKITIGNKEESVLEKDSNKIFIFFSMREWGHMISSADEIARTIWFWPDNYTYRIPVAVDGYFSFNEQKTDFTVSGWLGDAVLVDGGIKNGNLYDESLCVDGIEEKSIKFLYRNGYMAYVPASLMEIRLPKEKGFPLYRQAFVQSCSINKYEPSGYDYRSVDSQLETEVKDTRENLKYQLYVSGNSNILLAEWTDEQYKIFREYSTLDLLHIRQCIALSCAYMAAYDSVNSRVWHGVKREKDVWWK